MNLVYSSQHGEMCPECHQPKKECVCHKKIQGPARIHMEKRRGKPVTLISNLPLSTEEIKALGQKLRRSLGVGGSTKSQVIEIQGDVKDRVLEFLKKEGIKCK